MDQFYLITLIPFFIFGIVVLIFMAIQFGKVLNVPLRTPGRVRANRYPNVRREFQQLAQLYSGRVIPGILYELPRVTFDYHGQPVIVEAQYHGPQPAPDLRY